MDTFDEKSRAVNTRATVPLKETSSQSWAHTEVMKQQSNDFYWQLQKKFLHSGKIFFTNLKINIVFAFTYVWEALHC
jgi:hypothetical protein